MQKVSRCNDLNRLNFVKMKTYYISEFCNWLGRKKDSMDHGRREFQLAEVGAEIPPKALLPILNLESHYKISMMETTNALS